MYDTVAAYHKEGLMDLVIFYTCIHSLFFASHRFLIVPLFPYMSHLRSSRLQTFKYTVVLAIGLRRKLYLIQLSFATEETSSVKRYDH